MLEYAKMYIIYSFKFPEMLMEFLVRTYITSYCLNTAEESTGVLRKAETEYKGHRSLLMRTRNLLSTMQRQDVIDRYNSTPSFKRRNNHKNTYICY